MQRVLQDFAKPHFCSFLVGFADFCKRFCRILQKVLQEFAKGFAGVCKRFCKGLQTVLQGSAKVFFSSVLKHFLGLLHIPAKVIAGFCKRQFDKADCQVGKADCRMGKGASPQNLFIFSGWQVGLMGWQMDLPEWQMRLAEMANGKMDLLKWQRDLPKWQNVD